MMGHELYHVQKQEDKNWKGLFQSFGAEIEYIEVPPPYIYEYAWEQEVPYRNEESIFEAIKYLFSTDGSLPPQYYQNEVDAYTYELKTFSDVMSPEYKAEVEYSLWVVKCKLNIANKYYKK